MTNHLLASVDNLNLIILIDPPISPFTIYNFYYTAFYNKIVKGALQRQKPRV